MFNFIQTKASHIVGGEFELLHLSEFTYRLNMVMYFDVENGNPGARDEQVLVRIFRKSDNVAIGDVVMPYRSISRVDYFQPNCSNGEVVTDKIIYYEDVILSPEVFNDPGGYYIVWERCCRNYTITNIFSNDPQDIEGQFAGQSFYLEFPPVVIDGVPFVNSSPQLFPPLNDYACPYRNYWADFAGVDVDGDSLVYKFVTPKNTKTAQAVPLNGPNGGPFSDVIWRPPFSMGNVMAGSPTISISNDGFISVTPTMQGLFVFAVQCEEFRDGKKIGAVVRDFQLLVVDKCSDAEPPVITGKKFSDMGFPYKENMTVSFDDNTPDYERCFQVQVSDPDASKLGDNNYEKVKIDIIPLDFKTETDLAELLPENTSVALVNGSVEYFDICFKDCPPVSGGVFTIGIIAFDDACALPLSDTLRVKVEFDAPFNNPPDVYVESAGNAIGNNVDVIIGNKLDLDIVGKDADGDYLYLELIDTIGFDESQSFIFENIEGLGEVSSKLTWEPTCEDLLELYEPRNFSFEFRVIDISCNSSKHDNIVLDIYLKDVESLVEEFLPPNVFTPNNDGINDYFSLPFLPLDDCTGEFVDFIVFSRWGKEVYNSKDRNFKWGGNDVNSGVYYYVINFSNKELNGYVSVLY